MSGCRHANLTFGSGGYYIFCHGCGAKWTPGEDVQHQDQEEVKKATTNVCQNAPQGGERVTPPVDAARLRRVLREIQARAVGPVPEEQEPPRNRLQNIWSQAYNALDGVIVEGMDMDKQMAETTSKRKETLRPGDLVCLKSGGPAMTVEGLSLNDTHANCTWFTFEGLVDGRALASSEPNHRQFAVQALQRVEGHLVLDKSNNEEEE